MSLRNITDGDAVLRAMSEYRELGREEFLKRYGFGGSRQYVVPLDGRRYDAKAIVGAAHGYQLPDLGPLTADQFSGGAQGANIVLERLGFPVVDLRSWSVEDERAWRGAVWTEIERAGPTLEPSLVRELGVYGGAQGVWVDKERTQVLEPEGVAVGVLHTGRHYADDLDSSGIVYHYPTTRRPRKRDAGEVRAVKNAARLGLPIFVVSEAGQRRVVRRGWVADYDDEAQVFLIDFAASPDRVPTIPDVEAAPFPPIGKRRRKKAEVDRLQRDPQFKFEVLRRYQGRCVLSGLGVQEMLDAAHVIPVEDGGPDDERNGLLLIAGLHRAFDADLWAIDPETLRVVVRPQGPSLAEMGMKLDSLDQVRFPPHKEALEWRLRRFMTRNHLTELTDDGTVELHSG